MSRYDDLSLSLNVEALTLKDKSNYGDIVLESISLTTPKIIAVAPPAPIVSFARSVAGLLVRYDASDATVPFSVGDWTVPAGATLALSGANLRSGRTDNQNHWTIHTGLGIRGTVLTQMKAAMLDLGAVWGPSSRATAGTAYRDAIGGRIKLAFALNAEDTWTIYELTVAGPSQVATAPGNQINQNDVHRMSVYCSPTLIATKADILTFDKSFVPLNSPSALTGNVGFQHRNDFSSRLDISLFVACADRYITVTGTGLTNGQVLKVRKADGTVLASATVALGVGTVDMWGVDLDATAFDLALYQADGVTLKDVIVPAGGVWPGDQYTRN